MIVEEFQNTAKNNNMQVLLAIATHCWINGREEVETCSMVREKGEEEDRERELY